MKQLYFNPTIVNLASIVKFRFFVILLLAVLLGNAQQAFGAIAQRGAATTANSNTTTLTIAKPTGVVSGDVMLINIAQRGANSSPVLSGWTLISGVDLGGGTNRWGAVLYRVAGGAEPATYTFTLDNGATGSVGSMVAFSGVNATTPLDVTPNPISVQGDQTGISAATKTTTMANAAVIMFAMAANSSPTFSGWNTTSPGVLTELFDNQNAGRATVGAAWQIKAVAGSTGAGVATLNNNERNGGVIIVLRPLAAAVPTITSFSPASACSGTTPSITINGTNFTGVTDVKYNGSSIGFTYVSPTRINFTLPTGAASATVSVTTPGGTASATFTVNTLPSVGPITGPTKVCVSSTTPLNCTPTGAGGVWSSSNSGIASVNSSTGVVAGVAQGTATITYTYTDGNGCSNSSNMLMQVNNLPVLSGPSSMCVGTSGIDFTPASGGTWVSSDNLIASIDNSGHVTALASGSVTFTYTNTVTGCQASTALLPVYSMASIVSSPAPRSVCSGASASFTFTTSGSGTDYKWYKVGNPTPLANGVNISGATTNTLTLNPVATADAGNYYCVFTGFCSQVTSSNAALTVTEAVIITGQPVVSQSFCTGNTATFTINTNGAVFAYEWYKTGNPVALADGGNILGATTQTLTLSNLVSGDAGTYYCIVKGTSPCGDVVSSNSMLIVNQGPGITSHPASTQTVCSGSSVNFSVIASGGSLAYQWYKGGLPLSNGGNISGALSATLTINPAGPADSATDYYCVVSNGCVTPAISNNAELVVNQTPFISDYTAAICSGGIFSITPANGIPTIATIIPSNTTYSWAAPIVTGGIIGGNAGTNETSISQALVNPTNAIQTATYTVYPISGTAGNCAGASFQVVVTVNPVPFVNNISVGICSGQNLSVTPANGSGNTIPAGTTYSWSIPSVTGGMTGGTSGSGSSISITLTNPTNTMQTANYTVTATSGTCSGSIFTLAVRVNPQPTVAGSIPTQTICSGDPIADILLSNPNNISGTINYYWTRDNTSSITGMAASGSGSLISGNLTNTSNTQQTTIFSLHAMSDEGCVSTPVTVNVVVNPIPTAGATPTTQTICSGDLATLTFSNPNNITGAVSYDWERDNALVTGGSMTGSGSNYSQNLVNTTLMPQTVTFKITAKLNGCSSFINNLTVIVNPKADVAVSPSTTQTLCGETTFAGFTITNPNGLPGTTFGWSRNNTGVVTGFPNSGTGAVIPSGVFTNTGNTDTTTRFTMTAYTAGCPSTSVFVDVIVKPAPLVVATVTPASQSICHNSNISLSLNTTNNYVSGYIWERDNTGLVGGMVNSGSGALISGTLTNTSGSTQITTFKITATAPNGCTKIIYVPITVYSQLTVPTIGNSQTACLLSSPAPFTILTAPTGGTGSYTYQWQSSPNNTPANFTNITGATASTYQAPFLNFGADDTFYRLIVTDSRCGSVTSASIYVEVVTNGGLSFGVNSNLSGAVCPGTSFTPTINTAHFATSAVRFTWSADPAYITPATGGPTGTTSGVFAFIFRNSSASIGPLTVQNNGPTTVTVPVAITPSVYNYPGPPSGSFLCSVTQEIVNVTIYPKPQPTATAANTTICSGASSAINVLSNITDATTNYTWTRNNGNIASGNVTGAISGSGSGTHSTAFSITNVLTNTTFSSQNVTYSIIPTSNGCTGPTITITITVAPKITPGAITAVQTTICNGSTATLTDNGAASPAVYQWQSSTDGILYTPISGATSPNYTSGALTQNTYFIRSASQTTNSVACPVNSNAILISVNTVTAGSITAPNPTICNSSSAGILGNVANGSVNGTGNGTVSYQWESSTTGCSGWSSPIAGATSATYSPGALSVTTYFHRRTVSVLNGVTCYSPYTNCITVTVNWVNGGTIAGDQVLCGNNPAAFTVVTPASSLGSPLQYQWQISSDNLTYTNIPFANSATYDPPAGVVSQTYYQRVVSTTVNGVTCSGVSNFVVVTPNPVMPGSIGANRYVCYGGNPAAFTSSPGSGTGLTYQWEMSTVSSTGPWTPIGGANADVYDEPGPVYQTTYYQRIATGTVLGNSCSVPSNFVTVFVNDVTASVIDGNQTVCGSEDPVAFTVTTPSTGLNLTYQWQYSTVGCSGPWTNISGAMSPTYDPPIPTQTTYYHVVTSSVNGSTCSVASNCLTITSTSRVWNGSVNSDWHTPGNWSANSVPTASHCVVIPNVTPHPIVSNPAFAYNLSVLNGGILEISTAQSITVTDKVTVVAGGQFLIKDSADLVQINNVTNNGIINMERITQPMYRFDYTYWGSPLTLLSNFKLGGVGGLSPATQPDKFYSWNPSISNGNGGWNYETAATVMDPTRGYIVRAPQYFSTDPGTKVKYTANFIGTPNNGDILCPIYHGTLGAATNNDKYNLLGNPYPSAVDAEKFLSDTANTPIIDGTIYFWTHNSPPSASYVDPFYGDFIVNYTATDYASWNKLGGTGTTQAATTGGTTPNGFIAAGQGFFAKSTGTAPSGNPIIFRNDMRVQGNNPQFFKSAQSVEKHRIWLNLVSNSGEFNQILVGYAEGATEGLDRDYDGVRISDTGMILYSVITDKSLVIQGRPLPFNVEDQVPLGFKTVGQNTYAIRIDHVDGLFNDQNIYVEDKLLNIIHNLKESPYVFTSAMGTFNNRFVLRYTDAFLGIDNPVAATGAAALITNERLLIEASANIVQVDLFDLAGKLIRSYVTDAVQKNFAADFTFAEGIYMVKIKFENGDLVTRKLINSK